jgi:hypothetical protein
LFLKCGDFRALLKFHAIIRRESALLHSPFAPEKFILLLKSATDLGQIAFLLMKTGAELFATDLSSLKYIFSRDETLKNSVS